MPEPIRIQRSRQYKQVSPNGLPIVYVGRPGKWSNPFKAVKENGQWWVKDKEGNYWDAAHAEKGSAVRVCVRLYNAWIDGKILIKEVLLSDIKGKNLSCWCKIGEPCHADILLKIANQ